MNHRDVLVLVLPALLAAGCAPRIDLAAERQAVMAADSAFAVATARSGVEGWLEFFADSGVMFRPGGTIKGHAAIRRRRHLSRQLRHHLAQAAGRQLEGRARHRQS